MNRKTLVFSLSLLFFAVVIWAAPAYAGGWATIGVTEMPDQIVAGRPFTLEFMVWQHGNKAVHNLIWDNNRTIPVTPQVILHSPDSAETVTFDARPGKQKGLFIAEITVPTDGVWEWSISPDPLAGVTELKPLTVLPPPKAPVENGFQSPQFFLAGAGFPAWATAVAAISLLGALLLLAVRARRAEQPG